jgi:hypothetical protein
MRPVLLDRDGVPNQGPPDDLTALPTHRARLTAPDQLVPPPGAAVDAVPADGP